MKTTFIIETKLRELLPLVEKAIKEEPQYIDYYLDIKEKLLDADDTIGFVIND